MRRRRALRTLGTFAIVLALLGTPLAGAATRAELDAHEQAASDARQAAKEAEQRAQDLASQIESLEERMTAIERDIAALADDIQQAEARTDRLQQEVDGLRAEVRAKESQIASTQAEFDEESALLAARMQESYKQGDLFFIELLLGSKDIQDLIARTSLAQRVMRQNQEAAQELKETRISLESAKAELDRTLEAVDIKRSEAAAEEKKLKDLRAKHSAQLAQQKAVEDEKSALFAANKAEAKRLRALAEAEEAESERIARELYGNGSGYYAGEMTWPVPGFYRISSPFGPRICPFHGREIHSGIDIGRNLDPPKSIDGAAIVAAGDGTVIWAGWRGGYGNTIMVDHGNGVVTLYGHQQSGGIRVSKGQHVKEGMRIGTVGSTGYSTGPHLHFEVRINGTPVDPMKYLD
ncbi:MAG: peptidoglycan DD-metalloendopeptidase family protein [Actinomycetia bacterium]|nr:peptidoglycan DD-metalloendopeptidase family protein [Actinomycetes bacterium]